MKDSKFNDGGKEIVDDLDLSAERRVNQDHKRINDWLLERL